MSNNIPDHPDIAAALATGYPRGHREPRVVCCTECGCIMGGRTEVFFHEGDALCMGCCMERIIADYEPREIAEAMGATVKAAYECGEEDFQEGY